MRSRIASRAIQFSTGKPLLLVAGLIAGALAGPPVYATAQSMIQDVRVTNSPDEPVPVVTVGAGNVRVVEGPDVHTIGVSDTKRSTASAGGQSLTFPTKQLTVPEGKLFTARFMSGQIFTPAKECVVRTVGLANVPDNSRQDVFLSAKKVAPQRWIVPSSELLVDSPRQIVGEVACPNGSVSTSSETAFNFTITGDLTNDPTFSAP